MAQKNATFISVQRYCCTLHIIGGGVEARGSLELECGHQPGRCIRAFLDITKGSCREGFLEESFIWTFIIYMDFDFIHLVSFHLLILHCSTYIYRIFPDHLPLNSSLHY